MPIYGYKCEHGHVFELMQSFTDEPLTSCQVCGAPVRKVLYPVSVHFKGSGFYNTDYGTRRRAREAREAKARKDGASSGSESGSGAKTESSSSGSSSSTSGSDSSSSSSSSSSSESKKAA